MSAPAFAWAMERGATLKLKPADRLVLLYLADMANGEKVCWPGQEKIVEFTGLALRTVRVSLQRLHGLQLIRAETRDGFVTRYHVLRTDTPANHPGNSYQGTPANSLPLPRQIVPTHPGKSCSEPRQMVALTPANCPPDPFSTQEETLKTRVGAREGKQAKVEDSGEEASKPVAPVSEPPKAPVIGVATPGGGQSYTPPKAEADPLDAPVDPETVRAAFAEMRHALRMKAYPPRAAVLSRHEQIALCDDRPRPKAAYLTREQIHAASMVRQFAVMGG